MVGNFPSRLQLLSPAVNGVTVEAKVFNSWKNVGGMWEIMGEKFFMVFKKVF
jgi:hypothetical protein